MAFLVIIWHNVRNPFLVSGRGSSTIWNGLEQRRSFLCLRRSFVCLSS